MANRFGERIKGAAITRIGGGLLTSLMRSTRHELVEGHEVEREIVDAGRTAVYVLWHGRLLPCAYRYRRHGFGTLISRNRDGDHISRVVERWGYRIVRGSSSRGGSSSLRAIVRMLEQGTSVALTPDGPRGPRQKMKLGPLQAARRAGVPVVPVSAGAASAWYFGRWDRFLVPRPFTWIPVGLGTPVHIDEDADEDRMAEYALEIERSLDALTERVDLAAHARHG